MSNVKLFKLHPNGREYSAGKAHGGRIDTLAIDEDDCPVIIKYKQPTSETRRQVCPVFPVDSPAF